MTQKDWTSEEAAAAFQNITDTFTAVDGGIKFIQFMVAMQEFDRRADGDYKSGKLVDIMLQFSKLIDVTTTQI